jgi:homoserine O-acetyltransferase/O-succinyltransferase
MNRRKALELARSLNRACGADAVHLGMLLLTLLPVSVPAPAANYPPPVEGDFIIKDFQFASGESLPQLRIHYRTFGEPRADAAGVVRNAVLILHGTGGSGGSLVREEFAGELFGPGQPLDATRFFIVLPDGIGHGRSSKPSDGLRGHFPHYAYNDMVQAQYLLLTQGLKVNHARLILGTSMGGMHSWLWGEQRPRFMDALMPLGSLPAQIAGRNRIWRKTIIDAISHDPDWKGGDYQAEPPSLRTALEMLWLMGSNPVLRYQEAPTLAKADEVIDTYVAHGLKTEDANDLLYAVAASSDYDPGPGLGRIEAPLVAVNSADDLVNPPELGILEREIKRVPHGRAIVIPVSDSTRGHGSHTYAALWKQYLEQLLKSPER